MEEFYTNKEEEIDRKKLESDFLLVEEYLPAHKGLVLVCHDVIIKYNGGLLLVTRDNHPGKDNLWPIGGRIKKGVNIEESLKKITKKECNLEISNITELGYARTLFNTDPFGHGKGTDTISFMFFAEGFGKLKLDNHHSRPLILYKEQYNEEFKKVLHPYVKRIIDLSIKYL